MPTTLARPMVHLHWLFCLGLFAASSTGCCSFEMKWCAAKRQPVPCDNLAGLWEGSWESDYNGHNGKLRAIVTPCGPGKYRAHYHATFAMVIPYAYETVHNASTQGNVTYFSGVQDLGPLAGGVYHYNGYADGSTFVASYRADKDHGTFRMQRVRSGGGCGCGCGSSDACDNCACVPTAACASAPFHAPPVAVSDSPPQKNHTNDMELAPLPPGYTTIPDSD